MDVLAVVFPLYPTAGKNFDRCLTAVVCRFGTDLEKSLNLTLVVEFNNNIKNTCPGIVLEFCKIALENMDLSL